MRPLLALLLMLGLSSLCSDLVSVYLKSMHMNNRELGSVFTMSFLLLLCYTAAVFICLWVEFDLCL